MRTKKKIYAEQQKWLGEHIRLEDDWNALFSWYDHTGKIFEGETPQKTAKLVSGIIDTVKECVWTEAYHDALCWVLDDDCEYYEQKERLKQARAEYKNEKSQMIEICLLRIADKLRLKRLKRWVEKAREKRLNLIRDKFFPKTKTEEARQKIINHLQPGL